MTRLERPAIDYTALDAAMAFAEQTIRRTRHSLAILRTEASQLSAGQPSHPADAASGLAGSDV